MDIREIKIKKEMNKVTILALSWRDIQSPEKGGAEVQTHAMLSALPKDKYRIIHISPRFKGMEELNVIDGIEYHRYGTIYSVLVGAYKFYKNNKNDIDLVIDQCNTHRFFTPFYVPRKKRIFYIHQMTREIWRINMRHPFCYIGEIAEDFITRIYRKGWAITVSESTKANLVSLGFDPNKIIIVPQLLKQKPSQKDELKTKSKTPLFVYVGRYIPYKGIDTAVEAIGILKKKYPEIKMHILGEYFQGYVDKYLVPICQKYGITIGRTNGTDEFDISCDGFVSEEYKLEMLSTAHALLFPSIREGWGIPISEAAFVGTPSVVFDSDGLRDAVDYGRAGYITKENTANGLAKAMEQVIEDKELYEQMRISAYEFTKEYLGKDYIKDLDALLTRLTMESKNV